MSSSPTRKELREKTAALVNGLSRAQLRKEFGIARVADITGLDSIGIPVYTAVRPLSEVISIHSGKGLEPGAARAGAIMEAIEIDVSVKPVGPFVLKRPCNIPEDERLELIDCFPVRASAVNELTPLAWEQMTNIQNGESKFVPSDLVWMSSRIKDQPLIHFQCGSNGLASGATLEDAILSGLYEVIERDAWTISHYLSDNFGISPQRTPLIRLPESIESCVRKIEAADCRLHLFDISTDYPVPVFNAIILDFSGQVAGSFTGFGCHLNAEIAAIRAITEAVQGRCGYISGARDDLFRRQFILMKRVDQHKLDQMFNELPLGSSLSEYRQIEFPDVKTELRYLLKLIRQAGVSEVYVKELGKALESAIQVVRVFSPQCEPVKLDHWAPGLRCINYCDRRLGELTLKKTEEVEEGEEWKRA